MKKKFNSIFLLILLCIFSNLAHALDDQPYPDVKEGIVSIQIENPTHKAGYSVGDILTRHFIVNIKKPYTLIPESLPIIGYEKKYRGQPLGINVSDIHHSEKDDGDKIIHDITVSYQVFTTSVVAKPGALPTEYLRLINTESKGKDIVKYRIPSFEFVISPLSIFGQVKVEDDMSGYRGPLLLSANNEKIRLKVLLTILAVSLLSLLYILGKHAWLPRMGGPFAQTFRAIRRMPNDKSSLELAVTKMHESLNKTAGNSLFSDNLAEFIKQKPAFKAIENELLQFFVLSRHVFFEPNTIHEAGNDPIQWLATLCRRCRDCERGLIPDRKA